jgi:hypothetical protein
MHKRINGEKHMANNRKYSDEPYYSVKNDPQEDIGYSAVRRQHIPWANEVIKNVKKKSPPESPLKQWWLAEQEKEKNK